MNSILPDTLKAHPTNNEPIGVIYIVGRRHCGSTILDIVLGNAADAQSVGELIYGLSRYGKETVTGGGTVSTHPFWQQVRELFERTSDVSLPEAGRLLQSAFSYRNLPWLLVASPTSPHVRELVDLLERLYSAIRQTSGKSAVIDSGKRVTQAVFLARFVSSARIVHLVRNPLNVMSSHLKRAKKGETVAFFGNRISGDKVGFWVCTYLALNWTIGSGLAWMAEQIHRNKWLRLRFEDFLKEPLPTVDQLGNRLAIDVRPIKERMQKGLPMIASVNIGGNRVRFEPQLRVDPKRASGLDFPRLFQAWVVLLSMPFMPMFGYHTIQHERAAQRS